MQPGEFHLLALDLVQQRDVMPRLTEIHALQHRALLPAVVVAGNDDRRTGHPRELLVDEIDQIAMDAVMVEQVARDEKQIGSRSEDGIDHAGERIAHVPAVFAVVQVHVGGVRDLQRSDHRSGYVRAERFPGARAPAWIVDVSRASCRYPHRDRAAGTGASSREDEGRDPLNLSVTLNL
jgi:hypothetical protein